MDEQREEERDSSLSSPALLHPLQAAAHTNRTTNFFIDNILRADFGCRSARGPGAHTRPDSSCSNDSSVSSSVSSPASTRHCEADDASGVKSSSDSPGESSAQQLLWPAWVYCTRYSDRPSSGPRTRKLKKKKTESEDKRARTAFTAEQLQRLKSEFHISRYITEQRRQMLAHELKLNESQIKIWFQNKRAKLKKSSGFKNGLALQLMAQGLYNHSTSTTSTTSTSSSIQENEDGH